MANTRQTLQDAVTAVNKKDQVIQHFIEMVDGDRLLVTEENRDELLTLLKAAHRALD